MKQDIYSYHQRRWPDRPIRLASSLWLIMTSPGLQLLFIHRLTHALYTKHQIGAGHQWLWRALVLPLALPKWAIQARTKSQIANDCQIDGGVFFSEQGHIIYGATITGAGTVIGPRVTIGMSVLDAGRPKIGRDVWIGPDCIVYGPVTLGDGATLLPGTVLTKSIPAGVVMQGNPARLVSRNFNNVDLREGTDTDNLQYLKANWGT